MTVASDISDIFLESNVYTFFSINFWLSLKKKKNELKLGHLLVFTLHLISIIVRTQQKSKYRQFQIALACVITFQFLFKSMLAGMGYFHEKNKS